MAVPWALAMLPVHCEKYLNCEQFCTYGQRRIAFNQSSLTHQPSGQIPGCPSLQARGFHAQFSEGGYRFLRNG
jgi:hypothetical protein